MIIYKKENGFPLDITVKTKEYVEVMEDDEVWNGYESTIFDEKDKKIVSFKHPNIRDRVRWVNGFFQGIEYANENG